MKAQRGLIRERDQALAQLRGALEQARRESLAREARLDAVASLTFDLALLLDADLKVIFVNAGAGRLLAHGEPLGERLPDMMDAPELASFAQAALRETECLEERFVIGGPIIARAPKSSTAAGRRA